MLFETISAAVQLATVVNNTDWLKVIMNKEDRMKL
jgi:hypothetical protein